MLLKQKFLISAYPWFIGVCSDEPAAAAAGLTSLPPSTAAPQRRFCMQARPVAQRRPATSVAAEQRAVRRLLGGQHQRQGTRRWRRARTGRTRTTTRRRATRRDCPEPRAEPAAAQEGRAGGGRGVERGGRGGCAPRRAQAAPPQQPRPSRPRPRFGLGYEKLWIMQITHVYS